MKGMLLQTLGSAALVVSLMFSIGLQLQPGELATLRRRPRTVALGTVVNFVVIPALAWAMCAGLALSPEVTLGVMICAAAPGGPTAALYANNARSDLALAAGMTILLPVLGVLATPLLLSLTAELPAGARMPVGPMILSLIAMQIVPLAAGGALRRRREALALRLVPWASGLANTVLGLLVVTLTALKGHLLLSISGPSWLILLGLTLAALILGYLGVAPREIPTDVAEVLGSGGIRRSSGRSAALVAACRNVSVAIMLASTFVLDPVVDATVLSFGFVTFVLPLGLSLGWRWTDGRENSHEI